MLDTKYTLILIQLVFFYVQKRFNVLFNVNPSCEATRFASEIWPFKSGGLFARDRNQCFLDTNLHWFVDF